MVIVLLSATVLVSPLIGTVAACNGQNEENETRGGHDREHNRQCQEQDFMFYLRGTANVTGHVLVNNATMVVYKDATFVVNTTAFDPSGTFPLNIAAPQLVVDGVIIPQEYLAYEAILDGEVYKNTGGAYSGIVNTTVRETISIYTSANHNVNTLWGTLEMTAAGAFNGSDTLTAPLGELVLHQSIVSGHGTLGLEGVKVKGTSGRIFGKIDAKPTEIAYLVRVGTVVGWPIKSDDGWILFGSRALKAYPELREYVWQKNASLAPNGPYDKIGLHRLVKTGITPKGVVFILGCPMWGVGEQRISNPPGDSWTKYANYSDAIYWANRGFDVYAIDYRSHFIPTSLNASQLSFMADWGWDVWISDIKEAAEKVKAVSGSSKFFIAGECSGGEAALNYATKYWKDDLKGIILLDANFLGVTSYPIVGTTGTETNTYNLTLQMNNMKTSGTYAYTPTLTLTPTLAAYALQNPGAPAEYPPGTPLTPTINPLTTKPWTNITEYVTYNVQYNFPAYPGMFANLMGGYGNVTQFEYFDANRDFLPNRLTLETAAMANWVNCPYLTYDWNDHYKEINVPILAFATGLFMNRTGTFRFVNGINNTDFTGIMLKNYGHTDVYYGTYAARDVFEPAYQWMLSHRMLVGEGRLVIDNVRYQRRHGNLC